MMLALDRKKSSPRASAPARGARRRGILSAGAGPIRRRATSCACGGSCPRCSSPSKLEVGAPGDDFEREAEKMADRVMRMPSPAGAAGRTSGPKTQGQVSKAPASVRAVASSPGQPLAADTRAFFEPRFGWDFSSVRVHADRPADESARAVNAVAYTVGRDIVFAAGQFSPGTREGQQLLAHELTHVVQQSSGSPRVQRQGAPAPPCPASVALSSRARPVHVPSCGTTPVTASRSPASAPVTWSLANGATQTAPGVPAVVDPATTISNAAGTIGTITVSPTQTPGYIIVTATGPSGCFAWTPLNIASTPVGVGQTARVGALTNPAEYGAQFANTLNAASGNSADLFQVKVNERFSGLATPNAATHLVATPFGDFTLHSNPWTPNSDSPGWAVTTAGVQGPDNIGTDRNFIDVGRFVSSASNRTPTTTLTAATPVGFSVQQDLHWFCAQAAVGSQWVTPPFATLTHTRHLMQTGSNVTFVTGIPVPSLAANSDPYTGQPAIIGATATPNPVAASATVPPGSPRGTRPPPANTTTVTARTLPAPIPTGHDLRFSIQGNRRGCSINATTGVVTVGTRTGTITVRVRDAARGNRNFDEVPVTISATPAPAATPAAPPTSPTPTVNPPATPAQIAPPPPLPAAPSP